jgi:hypothetical protein
VTRTDLTEVRRLVAADPGALWALLCELFTWRRKAAA